MRMYLKNKNNKKYNIFTKKNYFIFLISFFIVSIIIGAIFFFYLNSNDKDIIVSNINDYFKINESYNYLSLLLNSLKNNIFNTFIIWLFGISVIGTLYNINLYFLEGFSIGFTIMAIFNAYKLKGLIGTLCFLFPSKLIYIVLMFVLTYFSIKFSYNIIEHLFLKKDISLQEKMKKYTKVLLVSLIISVICSLFEVFINPLMIKLFTFLLK